MMLGRHALMLFGLLQYIFLNGISVNVQDGDDETTNERLDTAWFELPAAGIYRGIQKPLEMEKIRGIFADPDDEIQTPKTGTLSPALILSGEDTGNTDFLADRTIKHSITEMSTLSKVGRVLKDKIPSCYALQEGAKLFFPTCPGDLVVITIAGSMKMTCNEIERRVFYGPVTIKSTECQQFFNFDKSCAEKGALRIRTDSCDNSKYESALIILSICFGLSVVILIGLIAWSVGMSRGARIGGKRACFTRRGCYYEFNYNEFINSNGKKEYSLEGEPSVVNMERKTFKKHWVMLLLTFLLCRSVSVEGYELLENYDTTILKYTYKLVLDDSEVIKMGSSTISREAVIHTSNIQHLFNTLKWELKTKEVYFCQWYKCESFSVCGLETLPFIKIGDKAQDMFRFNNPNRAYYTCQKLTGYCTFGNGCKLIAFEINPVNDEVFSVHSITIGGSHGGSITPPIGCIVDDVKDQSSGFIGDYLLVSNNKNKSYFCHRDLFSLKPEMGMLGDIQITDKGDVIFATNEVKCVTDFGNRAICRYSNTFIDNIDILCEDVSQLPFQVSIDYHEKLLSWKQSGEATVIMRCDRPIPLHSSSSHCVDIDVKVWEVAHLDSQLLLGFRANSLNGEGTYKFPKVVHINSHTFSCNGVQQFSELYDIRSLKASGLNYTMDSIPFTSINQIQEDHFSDKDPDDRDIGNLFSQVVKSVPFWSLSLTTTIILCILGLIMCRRLC